MNYGERLLITERGTSQRYVSVIDLDVWELIDSVLKPANPSNEVCWRVLAAAGDVVEGERLQNYDVCPHCFSRDVGQARSKDQGQIVEIDDVTFHAFRRLPIGERRHFIATSALNFLGSSG